MLQKWSMIELKHFLALKLFRIRKSFVNKRIITKDDSAVTNSNCLKAKKKNI